MKRALLLAGFLLTDGLAAQPVVIFAPNDVHVIAADGNPGRSSDSDQQEFLDRCAKILAAPAPLALALPVVSPPAWGKTVHADTSGNLQYQLTFRHGFVCRLALSHLLPDHRYILTLNGNPERAGNDLLPDPVPGNLREKYYDFLTITTDADGNYAAPLAVYLASGAYDVRFYVKDTTDFKIVLYRDFFRFTVE